MSSTLTFSLSYPKRVWKFEHFEISFVVWFIVALVISNYVTLRRPSLCLSSHPEESEHFEISFVVWFIVALVRFLCSTSSEANSHLPLFLSLHILLMPSHLSALWFCILISLLWVSLRIDVNWKSEIVNWGFEAAILKMWYSLLTEGKVDLLSLCSGLSV